MNVRLTIMMTHESSADFVEAPLNQLPTEERRILRSLIDAFPIDRFEPVTIPAVVFELLFGEKADPAAEVLDTRGTSNKNTQAETAWAIQDQLADQIGQFDSPRHCFALGNLLAVFGAAVSLYADLFTHECEFYIRVEQETEE